MRRSGKFLIGLALCSFGTVQAQAQSRSVESVAAPIVLAKKKSPAIWLVLGGVAAAVGVIVAVSEGSDKPVSP